MLQCVLTPAAVGASFCTDSPQAVEGAAALAEVASFPHAMLAVEAEGIPVAVAVEAPHPAFTAEAED